jgi:uncharacterized protein (DUF924 family)
VAGQGTQAVLDYWFGPDPFAPAELPGRLALWFGIGCSKRQRIHQGRELVLRFSPLLRDAAAGKLDHWSTSPHRLLSLILLLDPFRRLAFGGRAPAYAEDARAQTLALDGLAIGADAALPPIGRLFFYQPLRHAESLELQEESLAAHRRLAADAPALQREFFQGCLKEAEVDRDVIRRFGRFPQRNAVLARAATPEERDYLGKMREIKKAPQG